MPVADGLLKNLLDDRGIQKPLVDEEGIEVLNVES